MIYELVLWPKDGYVKVTVTELSPSWAHSDYKRDDRSRDFRSKGAQCSLLRICKLFYNEAKPVLFSSCVFDIVYVSVTLAI